MSKLYQVLVMCFICCLVFIFVDSNDDGKERKLSRSKRYLSFKNNTKFFLRLNFRANMVPWNQIFAQALGFRLNWDDPPDSFHPYHHFQRRDVYDKLEILMDKNGLNGFHCIRRAICEMRMLDEPKGIYHRILKMVFSQKNSSTNKWHSVDDEECQHSVNLCPFSMLDVSLFTDI